MIRGLFGGLYGGDHRRLSVPPGFDQTGARRTFPATLWGGGPLIGGIATLLGVGGSVMTVPLLRRHGYDMKYCVSAANPLSIRWR